MKRKLDLYSPQIENPLPMLARVIDPSFVNYAINDGYLLRVNVSLPLGDPAVTDSHTDYLRNVSILEEVLDESIMKALIGKDVTRSVRSTVRMDRSLIAL